VNTLKRDWTQETTFSHVLSVIRCLLIVPFPESSLNDEAGKLFMNSYDEYARRARLMTDVHGRSHPSAFDSNENSRKNVDDCNALVGGKNTRVLTESSGPIESLNGNRRVKIQNHQRRESKKQAAEKKNKKRSLKRL